jgi:NTE family protein
MKRLAWVALLLVSLGAWAEPRERIGLVLSGGGARGLTHIGVLKVLERERIPVDLIAGTSMGAIVGGLYASGLNAAQLEAELLKLDWEQVFASRVDRQHLSHRRKDEDYGFAAGVELGLRDGELRLPSGTVSSRVLEVLLRRLTLPVRHVEQFDALPTPFRAVATDMESGRAIVMGDGDLAQALRASMSVPGLFSPIERQDRVLGDGGLVNNVPVDVARGMGARRLIVVNIGTPLAGRDSLNSVLGLTSQMIAILTEQNVQRSLATLHREDVLLAPNLGELGSGDFERGAEFIRIGEASAEAQLKELRAFALPPAEYAAWRAARVRPPTDAPRLAALRFEGAVLSEPHRWLDILGSRAGQPFNAEEAVRDTRKLAASGDYSRVDFRLEPSLAGDELVFDLEEKPWGPNYLRIGLDLSTDDSGAGGFNLRLSHNRHWLNRLGAEWRNQATIGRNPRLFSEFYQPLSDTFGSTHDGFAAVWGELQRREQRLFDPAGSETAQLTRKALTWGLDFGRPWGRLGELRLGLWQETARWSKRISEIELPEARLGQLQRLRGVRLRVDIDQLDAASFPRDGWRLNLTGISGRQTGLADRAERLEASATHVRSWGLATLNLQARAARTRAQADVPGGPYTLGGFQQLSGLRTDQLSGNALLLLRASAYWRLSQHPVLTRGWFAGASLEAGNVWLEPGRIGLHGLRSAGSVFLGADTGIGPLYLALGAESGGGRAVYLFLGRP